MVKLPRLVLPVAWLALGLFACGSVDDWLDDADKATRPSTSSHAERAAGSTETEPCAGSFDAFKRAMERAGNRAPSDYHWHHIVEKNPDNARRFPDRLHCRDNLIAIPASIHARISGHYSSKQHWTRGETVRTVISRRSWEDQRAYGLEQLRKHGVSP